MPTSIYYLFLLPNHVPVQCMRQHYNGVLELSRDSDAYQTWSFLYIEWKWKYVLYFFQTNANIVEDYVSIKQFRPIILYENTQMTSPHAVNNKCQWKELLKMMFLLLKMYFVLKIAISLYNVLGNDNWLIHPQRIISDYRSYNNTRFRWRDDIWRVYGEEV